MNGRTHRRGILPRSRIPWTGGVSLRICLFGYLGVGAVLLSRPSAGRPLSRPISMAPAAITIYTEDRERQSAGATRLLVGVWSDGLIIWSHNRHDGGPPYWSSSISPARFTSLMSELERDGVFKNKHLAGMYYGPDSKFTVIVVKNGKHRLQMQSWHELYEDRLDAVATAAGLEPLGGRSRADVLKHQPVYYQQYRATWTRIRTLVQGLVPIVGIPVHGMLITKAGKLIWVEITKKPRKTDPPLRRTQLLRSPR